MERFIDQQDNFILNTIMNCEPMKPNKYMGNVLFCCPPESGKRNSAQVKGA